MSRHDQLKQEVIRFHAKHPIVWDLFVQFTFERIAKGFEHYSSKGIFERIRWETAAPNHDPADFKLNNNYTPFYARAFMKKYPKYVGFFRTRKQISKGGPAVSLPALKPGNFIP